MNTVPADIFEDELQAPVHRPTPEVRALARLPCRQAALHRPRRGRRRTGRTEQFACRITPAAAETIYRISSSKIGRSEQPSNVPLRPWKKKCGHEPPDREKRSHAFSRRAIPSLGFLPWGLVRPPWGSAIHSGFSRGDRRDTDN